MINALFGRQRDANGEGKRSEVAHSPGKVTLTQQFAHASIEAPGKATLTQQLPNTDQALDVATHHDGSAPHSPTSVSFNSDSSDMGSFVGPSAGLSSEGGDEEAGRILGGTATEAGTTNTKGPSWKDGGRFQWWIKWKTDGKKGWLVQKITNTYSGTHKNGAAITDHSVGVTPHYYEAWEVTSHGHVQPALGSTNDIWARPNLGKGSKGSWSMKGEVYWTNKNPEHSGLTPGGIRDAGILVSGHSAPAGIGDVLLTRNANGHWDSTKKNPTHTGSTK